MTVLDHFTIAFFAFVGGWASARQLRAQVASALARIQRIELHLNLPTPAAPAALAQEK